MDDQTNAQTLGKRERVASLDREFARLHVNSCALMASTPAQILYTLPPEQDAGVDSPSQQSLLSVGENILRSAAVIEQTFGGITASLWDDPFEWTLPEYLTTPEKVCAHLIEVEATRRRAFSSFTDDACLLKHIAVPAGGTRALSDLLQDTLLRAQAYQAQAQIVLGFVA